MPPQGPQPMPPQGPPHGMPPMPPMPPQGAPSMPPPMPPAMPTPDHAPSSLQKLPEWAGPKPDNMGTPKNGHKRELLQRLMSNLLSKPGRSMHEMINGVKDAISAYKNYAKEWDNLNGIASGAVAGGAVGAAAGAGASGIQKIMQDIEAKKGGGAPADGGGGPGFNPQMPGQRPQMPQPPMMHPQMPQAPQRPQGQGWGGEQDDGRGMGSGQAPHMVPPQQMGGGPSNGIPPVAGIPPIAGQPQASSFNRPAPVNSLGIWGH